MLRARLENGTLTVVRGSSLREPYVGVVRYRFRRNRGRFRAVFRRERTAARLVYWACAYGQATGVYWQQGNYRTTHARLPGGYIDELQRLPAP